MYHTDCTLLISNLATKLISFALKVKLQNLLLSNYKNNINQQSSNQIDKLYTKGKTTKSIIIQLQKQY